MVCHIGGNTNENIYQTPLLDQEQFPTPGMLNMPVCVQSTSKGLAKCGTVSKIRQGFEALKSGPRAKPMIMTEDVCSNRESVFTGQTGKETELNGTEKVGLGQRLASQEEELEIMQMNWHLVRFQMGN